MPAKRWCRLNHWSVYARRFAEDSVEVEIVVVFYTPAKNKKQLHNWGVSGWLGRIYGYIQTRSNNAKQLLASLFSSSITYSLFDNTWTLPLYMRKRVVSYLRTLILKLLARVVHIHTRTQWLGPQLCDTAITINTLYTSIHRLYSTDHAHVYVCTRTWLPVLIQLVCYLLLYSGQQVWIQTTQWYTCLRDYCITNGESHCHK